MINNSNNLLSHLLPVGWKDTVHQWLIEDTPSFDYGGFVVGDKQTQAKLYQKDFGIIAGIPFFNHVFHLLNCKVDWLVEEGHTLTAFENNSDRTVIAIVYGKANDILLGERPALNMLARASGIATRVKRLMDLKEKHNWHGIIAGTRKTTPEKYAMLVGGCDPHRMDLSTMIMLKDNHIQAQDGDITKAVKLAKSVGGFSLKVEVECQSVQEARIAIIAGADIVMLDNFTGETIKPAAKILKEEFFSLIGNDSRKFLIEGSGGLNESNCVEYFSPDVDILSFGSITQSVPHIDFSLKL